MFGKAELLCMFYFSCNNSVPEVAVGIILINSRRELD